MIKKSVKVARKKAQRKIKKRRRKRRKLFQMTQVANKLRIRVKRASGTDPT
jgi:hypothetical protein